MHDPRALEGQYVALFHPDAPLMIGMLHSTGRGVVVQRENRKFPPIEITADPDDPKRTPRVSVEVAREQILARVLRPVTDDYDVIVAKVTGDANTVVIARTGSTDLINGASSYTIYNQWQSAWLIADRSTNTWTVISSGISAVNTVVDSGTGNGSTPTITLSGDPGSKNNIILVIGGVYQQKATYSISGTTLTPGATIPNGVAWEAVWSAPLTVGTPSDGTVSTVKLQDGALAATVAGLAKMADGFLQATTAGLAKMADGFLAATTAGRAKMADLFVTPAKLSTGAPTWDTSGNVGFGVTPAYKAHAEGAVAAKRIGADQHIVLSADFGNVYVDSVNNANSSPMGIVFRHKISGGSLTEAVRIAPGGIAFPPTQNASSDANTLDDYEEGTWTPSLGGTATYTIQEGYYRKIGQLVYIQCKIVVNAIGTGSASVLSGLPFAALSAAQASSGAMAASYFASLAVSTITLAPYVANATTTIQFNGLAASGVTMNAGLAVFGSGTRIDFSGCYIASA